MKKAVFSIIFISVIYIFTGCIGFDVFNSDVPETDKPTENIKTSFEWDIEKSPLNNLPLIEDRRVYSNDDISSIAPIYITILPTKDKDTGKTITFSDVNNTDAYEIGSEPEVEILFQTGEQKISPESLLDFSSSQANASLRIRGRSTRNAKQKSYKISIYENSNPWMNQEKLNLNKHPYDSTRVKNKFCFDFFKIIPNMISLRTQFVNLFVKDLSGESKDTDFIDYGLYTHIEQPNKRFLRNHSLDPNGNLYKAEFFEFFRYPDNLTNVDDKFYNESNFEQILEIKEGKNHSKLLKMLDDVNNYGLDIEEIFDKHFNRENYLTWLAVNILFGNMDTSSQNFLLYSPQNAMTWYFFPWDYDDSLILDRFRKDYQIPDSYYGIANYWGSIIHKRFFKNPDNVELLSNKINELSNIIKRKNAENLTKSYKDIVVKYVFNLPDLKYLRDTPENVLIQINSFYECIEQNKQKYFNALENPMPVFLGNVSESSEKLVFSWEHSFDLQGDDISYLFEVSKYPDFSDNIIIKEETGQSSFTIKKPDKGIYFWRVLIYDSKGNVQLPFDNYIDECGNIFFGIKKFLVE
jgi:hypothetical protein